MANKTDWSVNLYNIIRPMSIIFILEYVIIKNEENNKLTNQIQLYLKILFLSNTKIK